jgi:hypothetical protein
VSSTACTRCFKLERWRTRCSRQRARPRSASDSRIGQPDRRHQIAARQLGEYPGVDPIGLASERRESFYFLRVGDVDLPAGQLEPVVYEAGAVHRLDRCADRRAMTIEPCRQVRQTVDVGRGRTDFDRHALTVKEMKVETLAAEI